MYNLIKPFEPVFEPTGPHSLDAVRAETSDYTVSCGQVISDGG